jgi:hypothetical protein
MEIHLSEKFSRIQVVRYENGLEIVQSSLWPSWNDLYQATKDDLTFEQLDSLENLFRNQIQSRDFEVVGDVLVIRFTNSNTI